MINIACKTIFYFENIKKEKKRGFLYVYAYKEVYPASVQTASLISGIKQNSM